MRRTLAALLLGLAALLADCAPKMQPPRTPGPPLAWAYPKADTTNFTPPAGPGPFHVPGSTLAFSKAQVADDGNPPDWFPGEHPAAPAVVAHDPGRGPTPCASCHLYNGEGFLGTPGLDGLSAAYIIEQVRAFRSGERRSAEPGRPATGEMIKVAQQVSDVDLARAAAYFAGLPHPPRLTVVETAMVPKTTPDKFGWLDIVPNGGREPIGRRVIEVSADMDHMLLADDHVSLIDYAPPGSLARGAALVASGGPGGQPCRSCHGAALHGVGDVPPLAGRSAPYLARMLVDIRTGARGGATVAQMQGPARGLSDDQVTDVVAYLASLKP